MYNRGKGTADHYWPRPVINSYFHTLRKAVDLKGRYPKERRKEISFLSGAEAFQGWTGGLEGGSGPGARGAGTWKEGLSAWGFGGPKGTGRTDGLRDGNSLPVL